MVHSGCSHVFLCLRILAATPLRVRGRSLYLFGAKFEQKVGHKVSREVRISVSAT